MTLKRPTKSGMRYFKADELKPETEATISAAPYHEQVPTDDGKPDERFRVPIVYNGEDGLWSPGDTAINILMDELTTEEAAWVGKKIRFNILEVKTKTGLRYAKGAHIVNSTPSP